MTGAEAPKGWRIVIISMVLPIVEPLVPYLREEIGRASCRERVFITV